MADTLIIACSKKELIQIMSKLDKTSKEYRLTVNKKKIQVIVNRNNTNIKEIGSFEIIERIVYLGSLITNKRGGDEETDLQ